MEESGFYSFSSGEYRDKYIFINKDKIVENLSKLLNCDTKDEQEKFITKYIIDAPLEMKHAGSQRYGIEKKNHELSFFDMQRHFFGIESKCTQEKYVNKGIFCQSTVTDGKQCVKIIIIETEDIPQYFYQKWFYCPRIIVNASLHTLVFKKTV